MTKKELEIENRRLKFELEWLKTLMRGEAKKILEEVK